MAWRRSTAKVRPDIGGLQLSAVGQFDRLVKTAGPEPNAVVGTGPFRPTLRVNGPFLFGDWSLLIEGAIFVFAWNRLSSDGILELEIPQTLRLGPAKPRRGCVMERHRFKQTQSLEQRLAEEAKRLRAEAKLLPPGAVRDELIRRARQAETGSHMSEWLRSPGLRPPE